jgi:hypothetical protein
VPRIFIDEILRRVYPEWRFFSHGVYPEYTFFDRLRMSG